MEAQRGYEAGSSLGLVEEDEGPPAGGLGGGGGGGPGLTQAQLQRVALAEGLVEERDTEIKKVRRLGGEGVEAACAHCCCELLLRGPPFLASQVCSLPAAHITVISPSSLRSWTRLWSWPR